MPSLIEIIIILGITMLNVIILGINVKIWAEIAARR